MCKYLYADNTYGQKTSASALTKEICEYNSITKIKTIKNTSNKPYIHRVGSVTIQCIACIGSLSWQPVVSATQMGNIVPRKGIKPTYLAFWSSVIVLHHACSLMSALYPNPSVYAAPCLRGQCRLD